jgi:hypothetical protein
MMSPWVHGEGRGKSASWSGTCSFAIGRRQPIKADWTERPDALGAL